MSYNISEEKARLRKLYRLKRSGIPQKERAEKSLIITEKLLKMPELLQSGVVFTYISFKDEVDTSKLICSLIGIGKTVAVPVCKSDGIMEAYEIKGTDGLIKNRYGISEPDIHKSVLVPKNSIDTIIVPGLAFDKNGFRLGYGGGYYDRYIDGFIGKTIGITFHECYTDKLPAFETDKTVNRVITERDL